MFTAGWVASADVSGVPVFVPAGAEIMGGCTTAGGGSVRGRTKVGAVTGTARTRTAWTSAEGLPASTRTPSVTFAGGVRAFVCNGVRGTSMTSSVARRDDCVTSMTSSGISDLGVISGGVCVKAYEAASDAGPGAAAATVDAGDETTLGGMDSRGAAARGEVSGFAVGSGRMSLTSAVGGRVGRGETCGMAVSVCGAPTSAGETVASVCA